MGRRTPGRPRGLKDPALRFWLLLLILAYAALQLLRPGPPLPEDPQVGRELWLYLMPHHGEKAKARLEELLAGAEEEVLGAFYEFRDLRVAQALLEAKGRGLKVQIYGERDYQEDFRRYLVGAALGQKEEPPRVPAREIRARVRPLGEGCEEIAGIPLCYDGDPEAFMHHKFLVVDRKWVFTGSTNMTWNAFARNNENSLLFLSPTLAQGYAREFLALFQGDRRGLGEAVAFRLEDPPLEGTAYFSPKGGEKAKEAILERLREARGEILVVAFTLTDREILRALQGAHDRGVRVQVLLETRNLGQSREEGLRGPGIRRDGNPYTLHHKFMVIDGRYVITGSYNFSFRASQVNNENLLVLQGERLAQRYREEALRLFRESLPLD